MPQAWPNVEWTDARREQVRQLWEAGFTAGQIARRLDIGVTKNAIIGLVHRNGFVRPLSRKKPRKPTPTKKKRAAPKQPRPVAVHVTPPPPPPPPTPIGELTIDELQEHHCRWPTGDSPFRFCGDHRRDGSSYCDTHHRRGTHG
jgi:hypothetical protein